MARSAAGQTAFTTVRSEGGLLPPDLLGRIANGDPDLKGLAPEDYGLGKGGRLNEAIAQAWERVKAYWAAYQAATSGLTDRESGVTETREQWLLPLFRELGYGRLAFRPAAEEIDGRRYAISHQTADGLVPVHLVSFRQALDRSGADGSGGRTSPHALMQDYLNRTPALWGLTSNGKLLRVLRDNQKLSRAAYVEFDLEAMLDGGVYADFALLYLTLHRSRLPSEGQRPEQCWLERWRLAAEERGARALDELRTGVETAIRALGQGMLAHPSNADLRDRLYSGTLKTPAYYRQLLRLVYRFLFLLAAEDRDLLFERDVDPRRREVYDRFYGVGRLRELVAKRRHADRYDDLWRSLQITFTSLREDAAAARLGLKPLAGGLFGPTACPDLEAALISNEALLKAIGGLTFAQTNGVTRRINYRDMDVEELGSVYESLLELQPALSISGPRPSFDLGHSGERKSTGSYYTNPGLVHELIRSALEPVLAQVTEQRLSPAEKRRRLLDLKVCDPACGSGHFLLAAARRIGREIARIDAGEAEPDPETARHATREAIAHCVYGVDLNPLAVDLCKLALWLEAHEPGKPIGFLDHHIRQGNSLVGATNALMADGIPDAAFEPVTGDEKPYARDAKRRNAQERKGQRGLEELGWHVVPIADASAYQRYAEALEAEDDSVTIVRSQERAFDRYRHSPDFLRRQLVADLWTAAFFWPLTTGAPQPPTEAAWRRLAADPRLVDYIDTRKREEVKTRAEYRTVRQARNLGNRHAFFHWELDFPEVFDRSDPGFDCILGNPPWDQVQPEEKKFFATRAPEIAAAAGARRKALIEKLPESNPSLRTAWLGHVREMELLSAFCRTSGHFPLTSFGKINTYSVFAELMSRTIRRAGRAGIIVPTGIATDDTNKAFFGWLVDEGRIASLYDFENREGLFPAVDSRMKFSLLALAGRRGQGASFDVAFFLTQPSQLHESGRRFALSATDIALLNPNTKTCPIFRSARDAELTKAIYRAAPVLVNEAAGDAGNPWGITLKQGLFNMTSDSHLFRTREQLEAQGAHLDPDGRFRRDLPPSPVHGRGAGGEGCYLPLYEAKLIHQFDHRFATYTPNRRHPQHN